MTKKDFALIASVLNHTVHSSHEDRCIAMANSLAKTNPRFDRQKFMEACGL